MGLSPYDDALRDRAPTSHEQRAGVPWDASYRDGPAPWDLGRPQPAIARLAEDGGLRGDVLDAGCGTGEHALCAAAQGLRVLGFDVAETALATARRHAADRGLVAEFLTADALRLAGLGGRRFDTVLDCGLFHTFDHDERRRYVAELAGVTRPDGTLHLLCFGGTASDARPHGPHPVSEEELRAPFAAASWRVDDVTEALIETRFATDGVPAWLARIRRT